jgi:bifunctional non-homologous end joining protein LigD
VKPRSATPAALPDFVEPMQAKLVTSAPAGDWIYEVKFDGYRALAIRGSETRLLSRNQKDLGKKFPEIVDAIGDLDLQDAIIDGEIVALDDQGRSSFQALQAFDMDTERPPIVLSDRVTDLSYTYPLADESSKYLAHGYTHVSDSPRFGSGASLG